MLDSSVQVARVLAASPLQLDIEAILAHPTVHGLSTRYILMEYQRTVWADYVHVHNLVRRTADVSQVLFHLLDGQRALRPRAAVRCTRIVSQTLAVAGHDRARMLRFLEAQIDFDLRYRFWRHVTPLPDPIGCDLVTAGVQHQPDGTYTVASTCRKDVATCHLPDFLAGHRPELYAIADHLAAHPDAIKDQPRVERLLVAVLADPRAALGQAACWPLGDVIIALQVPPDAALWTLDPDFEPLAAVLGLRLYQPPQIANP